MRELLRVDGVEVASVPQHAIAATVRVEGKRTPVAASSVAAAGEAVNNLLS
jgi:hypothetical protein